MFKSLIKSLTTFAYSVVGLLILLQFQIPSVHAASTTPMANPQVAIALPSGGGPAVGHPGTKVSITGSGFTPTATVALYTTPTNDPTKCIAGSSPGALGLTSFATSPTVPVKADGTFTVDTTWPSNASIATTAYYICAVSSDHTAFSTTTFTVAQAVAITITPQSPTTVIPGGQVTIAGTNWLPPQTMTVAIVFPTQAGVVVSQNVKSDSAGSFSVALTIPTTTPAGTYSVSVIANAEPTPAMKILQANAVTVADQATPTPTPTPSPTATVTETAVVTPTATPSTNNTGNTGGGPSLLVLTLGGVGAILVIVGIIFFMVYSRK